MRKLIRFLTRDASLIAVECWYEGMVKRTEAFFSMPFPENLFVFRRGTVECYRDERINKSLPLELAEWAKSNQGKIPEGYQLLTNALQVLERVNKDIPQNALENLKEVREVFANGMPGLVITYLFPIWQKDFKLFAPELIEEAESWRKKTEQFFDSSVETIHKLLEQIAAEKGYDKKLLKFIMYDELIKGMSDELVKELEKRESSVFAYMDGQIIYEQDIDKALSARGLVIEEEEVKVTDEIKGSIANKGLVTGKVKVVFNREQLEKVKEGNILVAPMTTPWYLPAIKKASAIVTDEGGITCHAAIVSREMNKPCIIGTKIATKIFKDRDLVEVDADKGIVRKVKPAKSN